MLARTPSYCFCGKVLWFCFSRSLKAIKRRWARFGPSFAVVNIIKMIFIMKLRLHEGRARQWWFCFAICFDEISQNVHNLWNLSCRSLKSRKKERLQRQFPRYLQFCVIFLFLKFGPMNCFYQQALGRAQICLMVQQIFWNSICGNVINLAQKIPILFVAKHYEIEKNFVKICIWACVNFWLSRLLAIVPTVFCFRFFRRIESLCSHPDLARSKNPMEPPETSKLKNREIEADTFVQAFLQNMRESQWTLSRYSPQS